MNLKDNLESVNVLEYNSACSLGTRAVERNIFGNKQNIYRWKGNLLEINIPFK